MTSDTKTLPCKSPAPSKSVTDGAVSEKLTCMWQSSRHILQQLCACSGGGGVSTVDILLHLDGVDASGGGILGRFNSMTTGKVTRRQLLCTF